ncbi:MAG: phosphoribosylformylglycinamidine synthase subunit PurS, partial [Anaerolineae bacterium]|nr:phosphoribosylformylglycinamidine synthase subunit PurS [Phycisphaerae bacterium]
MIFRIDVSPLGTDRTGESVRQQIAELGCADVGSINTSRVYLIDVDASPSEVERVAFDLLADPIVERAALISEQVVDGTGSRIEIHLKPG